MKVLLTKREAITAKNGQKWVKYEGISNEGATVEFLIASDAETEYGVSEANVASKQTLKEILSTQKLVSVEFNQKGRVTDISA